MNRFDTEYETPPLAKGRGTPSTSGKKWCGEGWQLTAIFWVVLIGVSAFVALEIAIVAKSDDLDQTSRSTVAMRNETVAMRQNVEAYLKRVTSHFPANQDTVSVEQIVDTIDKVHAMMLWASDLKAGIPPETIQQLVKNADKLVGNVTSVVGTVKGLFDSLSGDSNNERHRAMVSNAALFFAKGAELLGTVSPDEFHSTFKATHEAIQSMAKLSQNISQERVNRIVESVSDILGAVESEHIVSVTGNLVRGATEVIERFTRPLDAAAALLAQQPVAAASAPAIARLSLPVAVKK